MKIRFTFVGTEYKPITIDTANEKSNFFIGKSFPSMLGGIPNDKILVMALESQMNAEPQPASPLAINPGFPPLQNCQSQQLGYHGYAYNYTCSDPLIFAPSDLIVNDVNSPKFFARIPEELMPFIQFLTNEHQCSPTIKVEVLNKNDDVIFTDNIVNYGYHRMPDTVTLEDVLVQVIKSKITNGDFYLK